MGKILWKGSLSKRVELRGFRERRDSYVARVLKYKVWERSRSQETEQHGEYSYCLELPIVLATKLRPK